MSFDCFCSWNGAAAAVTHRESCHFCCGPASQLLLPSPACHRHGLHGNPHSEAGWAPESRGAAAAAARLATLRMCGADPEQYDCIFTAGATGAFLRWLVEFFRGRLVVCFLCCL